MTSRALVAAAAVVLALTATAARADIVELRNGEHVEGKLQQASPAFVAIEVNGRMLTYPTDQVLTIRFGTPSPPAPAGAGSSDTPATPARPGAPAAPVARATTPPRAPEARDALTALQEFREFLGGGVNYAEYSAKLADVRKKVERVPRGGLASTDGVPELERALRYYTVARSAWEQSRQNPAGQVDDTTLADLRREPCGALRTLTSRDRAAVLTVCWMCAADAVEDAARILR